MVNLQSSRRGIHGAVALAFITLLAGCQQETGSTGEGVAVEPEQEAAPIPQLTEAPVAEPEPQAPATPAETDMPAVAEAAREDLAARRGVPMEKVALLEARSVYWRTSALGCPDPEMAYAQVLTKGWFIRLAVGRAEYRYHASETGEPFTCNPRRAEPPLEYSVD